MCEKGELFDFVEQAEGLPEPYARSVFRQILEGLDCIHKNKLAHRDIKLENCFLDENAVVKIADFGLTKNAENPMKTKCGTPGYMPPEICSPNYDGQAVDIFACGVMLFLIILARPPFGNSNDIYY